MSVGLSKTNFSALTNSATGDKFKEQYGLGVVERTVLYNP